MKITDLKTFVVENPPLFGTHGQMTASSAIRLAKRLEKFDPLWFEEPVPPENIEEMARVARSTSIPIATGERLATKYEFAGLLNKQAASILQMALGRVRGILEAKKIAGMAEAHYALIAPHLYCGPIEGAANIQIDTCSPNFLIQEGIQTWDGFQAEILKEPIRWQEGYIIPPTRPGLGVELDEAVAARHPYAGTRLHLEMLDEPVQ
jgi:2-dehydro-3-deoxyphosphogalactonate aldolase